MAWILALGAVIGVSSTIALNRLWVHSSSNESCMSCHAHPQSDRSWKLSVHHNSKSGVVTDCASCHLPPKGTLQYFATKSRMGIKDVWSHLTKDSASLEWGHRSSLDYAQKIVYNESCKACHQQLFPERLSDEGITAHLYYEDREKELDLQCISCHLDAGHHDPNFSHERLQGVPTPQRKGEIFTQATPVDSFASYTEQIPQTSLSFRMIALPGGSFTLGSPEDEPLRREDESPQRSVELSPFFIGEIEVSWDLYWAFFAETLSEGRIPPQELIHSNALLAEQVAAGRNRADAAADEQPYVDALSGPTPPFGNPDQGWGGGDRPAITMTHYAAEVFCQWLSYKTGKHYSLPTEAQWEYAARGGSDTPYFFEGSPRRYSDQGWWRSLVGADTALISRYVHYEGNTLHQSALPERVQANPFGLKHTLGNVMEYCSDFYSADSYAQLSEGARDPQGVSSGTEYVVRGGSFVDDAADLRCAARSHTEHDKWLKTDPQNPKSIWWYSDIKPIGFRVVCSWSEEPKNEK